MDYKGREPPQLHVASLGVARGVQYSPHLTRCGIALRLFRVRLHLAPRDDCSDVLSTESQKHLIATVDDGVGSEAHARRVRRSERCRPARCALALNIEAKCFAVLAQLIRKPTPTPTPTP